MKRTDKSIAIGRAVVIFDPQVGAWIAPGGKRLHSEERARQLAEELSEVMRDCWHLVGTGISRRRHG